MQEGSSHRPRSCAGNGGACGRLRSYALLTIGRSTMFVLACLVPILLVRIHAFGDELPLFPIDETPRITVPDATAPASPPGGMAPESAIQPQRSPFAPAEFVDPAALQQPDVELDFDWSQQRLSVADLNVGEQFRYGPPIRFRHRQPDLTDAETQSYVELINTIEFRRLAAQKNAAGELLPESATVNIWEASFYKFEEARRLAWKNGKLQIQSPRDLRTQSPADPFEGPAASTSRVRPLLAAIDPANYSLMGDMLTHPNDFVGRPIAMYGLFTPSGAIELPNPNAIGSGSQVLKLQRGFLRNLTDTEDLAIIDAGGRLGPNNQIQPVETWPGDKSTAIPVLVKGWFIKLWGQQPLVLTESVRMLTPRPYEQVIRTFVKPRTPISEDEKWIYYETLRQMQLSSAAPQEQLALDIQQRRLSSLAEEIREKVTADHVLLEGELKSGLIGDEQFRNRKRTLARQLASRLARNESYRQHPESFPLYADIFTNPDKWQGSLVTLRGYVRQVVSYPGDDSMFGGQTLHELWLFTEDSQHNPAVIITPTLPKDFPTGAAVVDRITVTGCFFKPYVYRSAKTAVQRSTSEHRIAPLILAGRISWNPTDDQIRALADAGNLPADTGIVKAAIRRGESQLSQATVMLTGFLAIVVMMTIWGRMQRDRREQRRLMALVDGSREVRHTLFDEASYESVPAFSSASQSDRFRG